MQASVPPVMAASATPQRIICAACMIAWLAEAQALATANVGPRRPQAMLMWLAEAFGHQAHDGQRMRAGAFSPYRRRLCSSWVVFAAHAGADDHRGALAELPSWRSRGRIARPLRAPRTARIAKCDRAAATCARRWLRWGRRSPAPERRSSRADGRHPCGCNARSALRPSRRPLPQRLGADAERADRAHAGDRPRGASRR